MHSVTQNTHLIHEYVSWFPIHFKLSHPHFERCINKPQHPETKINLAIPCQNRSWNIRRFFRIFPLECLHNLMNRYLCRFSSRFIAALICHPNLFASRGTIDSCLFICELNLKLSGKLCWELWIDNRVICWFLLRRWHTDLATTSELFLVFTEEFH